MKIIDIEIGHISVPLKRPFKTALRTVTSVEDIIVIIKTDSNNVGYGEAPPTVTASAAASSTGSSSTISFICTTAA